MEPARTATFRLTAGVLRVSLATTVTPLWRTVRVGESPAWTTATSDLRRLRLEPPDRPVGCREHPTGRLVHLLDRGVGDPAWKHREGLDVRDGREVAELMCDVRHAVVVEHQPGAELRLRARHFGRCDAAAQHLRHRVQSGSLHGGERGAL